jgi:3-oxoacyl-[acyl-carrier protein] reductase
MTVRSVLITGASQGLGAHLVERFWNAGYSVGLSGRNSAKLEFIVDGLGSRDKQTTWVFAEDLAEEGAPERLFLAVSRQMPSLNVLINNAAIQGPIGPVWDGDWSDWKKTIQVNLMAPVVLCRKSAALMVKNTEGSIINISGGGAASPRANFSAYATAKAGLVRFSETLADEVRSLGVRVNCISPGAMRTSMLKEVLEQGADAAGQHEFSLAEKVFSEGGASMDRVADLSLFLASNESKGITGKLISAVWDRWEDWLPHLETLSTSDVYTLRRITGRDRCLDWGDK